MDLEETLLTSLVWNHIQATSLCSDITAQNGDLNPARHDIINIQGGRRKLAQAASPDKQVHEHPWPTEPREVSQ